MSRMYWKLSGIGSILILGFFIADSLLFDGVKPREIQEDGFQGTYFAKKSSEKKAVLVLIGGGQWGAYWGQEVTKNGYVGFSLPYTRKQGLPNAAEEIELEYFERALTWLKQQPEVDPAKVIVMGASRNAELALILAAGLPNLVDGVIAYAPSSVAWSNTVLPYNSDEVKASWTYRGEDIPYVRMKKMEGNDAGTLNTLAYWQQGLDNKVEVERASIKVEQIKGPILLFSGLDDQVWPSAYMADQIAKRITEHGFRFSFHNKKYPHAGHLISSNPESHSAQRTGTMKINGSDYKYNFGGTAEGDLEAKKDAKKNVFQFMRALSLDSDGMEKRELK